MAHQNYVEAAITSGFGTARIVLRHVIPNIFLTLVVYATLDLGTVVLLRRTRATWDFPSRLRRPTGDTW